LDADAADGDADQNADAHADENGDRDDLGPVPSRPLHR
jgi:hypothetical protein